MLCITKIRNYWILWLCFTVCEGQLVRVTDVKCVPVDETFVKIVKCFTERFGATLTETTINITLLQEMTTGSVKLQFRRKSNGKYNPYFHGDVSIDVCKFLANRAVYPLGNYIFSAVEEFSNVSHSCPYKDYVVLDRFRVDMKKFKWIPTTSGDYSIYSHWYVNGQKRLQFEVYFSFGD